MSGPEDATTAGAPAREPAPASAWNIANALTLLRIALVPVFGWLLLLEGGEQPRYRIAAGIVFAIASITDRIDGDLARARGIVTDFGKVADPIADKALVGMALVGLSLLDLLPWWVTIIVLVREIGVTAMRFFVIRHGIMAASRGGKVKTALQGLAIFLYVLPLDDGFWHIIALVIMTVAVVITIVTGLDYVVRAQTLRTTSPRALAQRERRAAMLREGAARLKATTETARRAGRGETPWRDPVRRDPSQRAAGQDAVVRDSARREAEPPVEDTDLRSPHAPPDTSS